MAAVLEAWTYNDTAGSATSIVLTKPAGVSAGDSLVLIVGSSDNTDSTTFDAVTGWDKQVEAGTSIADAKLGVYTRKATGGEGASETVTVSTGADPIAGFYLRISGTDATTHVNVVGTSSEVAGEASILSLALTTTVDGCLAFSIHAFDGGDGFPNVTSGTGWPAGPEANAEIRTGAAASDVSIGFVKKTITTAGTSENVTWSWSGGSFSDGRATVQIAFAPGATAQSITDVGVASTESVGVESVHLPQDTVDISTVIYNLTTISAAVYDNIAISATVYDYISIEAQL